MRSAFFVRPGLASDWAAIRWCFRDAGKAAWSGFISEENLKTLEANEGWKDGIYTRSPMNATLVVEAEATVVGFSVIRPSMDADALHLTGEIDAFYIDPKFWSQGGGQELMEKSIRHLKAAEYGQATLWTEVRNTRARKFYELAGWREDGATRQRTAVGTELTEVRYLMNF